MNHKQFLKRFPTDDACLEHLMKVRYGVRVPCRCNRDATYHRVAGRRCWECASCGKQVYPTAGTPFENTRTSLRDWFYVMFLFCSSRNGVAAKEVERQLGVTYKTAWRMCNLIRKYMGYVDGDFPIGGDGPKSGVVEVDHAFIGGKDKRGKDDKAIVLGMLERDGDVMTRVVPNLGTDESVGHIVQNVRTGSRVASDEGVTFRDLKREGFWHASVNHSIKEYVRGDVHTNTIESFWSNVKRGINGTYIHVSQKHLPSYLCEFEYRHNLRRSPELMLDCLLQAFPTAQVG